MRIIAGDLRGRIFASPHGHRTHPMSDKIRGALFNTLGDIDGLKLLDAFAGSGAIAFEALSRGAASVVLIENDINAQKAIAQNIRELGLAGQAKLIRAAAQAWARSSEEMFDIVALDPPYDQINADILQTVAGHCLVGGLVVLSLPPDSDINLPLGFRQIHRKRYGDAQLVFYRRTS